MHCTDSLEYEEGTSVTVWDANVYMTLLEPGSPGGGGGGGGGVWQVGAAAAKRLSVAAETASNFAAGKLLPCCLFRGRQQQAMPSTQKILG